MRNLNQLPNPTTAEFKNSNKNDLNVSFDEEDIRVTTHEEDYQVCELLNFKDASFVPEFYEVIKQLKFERPTSIQTYAIPIALDKKDLIAIAKTGSGKTLAFMLPGIQSIIEEKQYIQTQGLHHDNRFCPLGLVLAPTRELANQIYEASLQFSRKTGIEIRVVYGGADIHLQKKKLKDGVDILIATPGRLIDFIERGIIDLSKVFYFVLDEADRMLDMGFIPQVKAIINELPQDRQTLMWSATWPKEVEILASEVCNNCPVEIKVGNQD